jgi:hypothetical protein
MFSDCSLSPVGGREGDEEGSTPSNANLQQQGEPSTMQFFLHILQQQGD